MTDPFWWVNTVDVEPRTGRDSYKPTYDPARTVQCWIEDEIKTVRDSDGKETTSATTLYMSIDDALGIPLNSRVTTPTRTAFVIAKSVFDSGSLDMGLDHAVLHLT